MKTNTTNTVLFAQRAIAAAILLAVPIGVYASDDSDDIIVRSQPAMEQWQAETTKDLNRYLRGRPTTSRARPNNAIVQVSFEVGEDGKADNVRLYRSDGNAVANHMATRAVGRLANLDEVPVSNPQDAKFLANIVFADNNRIHDRLLERLDQSERERMASSGAARTFIALRN